MDLYPARRTFSAFFRARLLPRATPPPRCYSPSDASLPAASVVRSLPAERFTAQNRATACSVIPLTLARHAGQLARIFNHLLAHASWNACPHSSARTASPRRTSSQHIAQASSMTSASASPPPPLRSASARHRSSPATHRGSDATVARVAGREASSEASSERRRRRRRRRPLLRRGAERRRRRARRRGRGRRPPLFRDRLRLRRLRRRRGEARRRALRGRRGGRVVVGVGVVRLPPSRRAGATRVVFARGRGSSSGTRTRRGRGGEGARRSTRSTRRRRTGQRCSTRRRAPATARARRGKKTLGGGPGGRATTSASRRGRRRDPARRRGIGARRVTREGRARVTRARAGSGRASARTPRRGSPEEAPRDDSLVTRGRPEEAGFGGFSFFSPRRAGLVVFFMGRNRSSRKPRRSSNTRPTGLPGSRSGGLRRPSSSSRARRPAQNHTVRSLRVRAVSVGRRRPPPARLLRPSSAPP